MEKKPNIFICPLDWGIGHATRCVPIINEFIEQGANVIIGADNKPLAFLKNEFPDLDFIKFAGYRFKYPKSKRMALSMMKSAPKILQDIETENQFLQELIGEKEINAVVSDNRFGLWSKNIPTIFMTHQINIQIPAYLSIFNRMLLQMNSKYINNFDELWVPDVEDDINLSGDLSHGFNIPDTYYIGPMTRFSRANYSQGNPINDLLVMLSGPEPQRSMLEEKILNQLKDTTYKAVVLRGLPDKTEVYDLNENIKVYSHMNTNSFQELLQTSKLVICRPGYSSIMDLAVLGKKAILIPTPGQTEQEYLAKFHSVKGHFFTISQNKFDLETAIEKSATYTGIKISKNQDMLKSRIKSLLHKITLKLSKE